MQQVLDLFFHAITTNGWIFIGLIFVFGLVIGSFLNVVIHRVPIMLERAWTAEARLILSGASADEAPKSDERPYNLFVPRSGCPKCGAMITAAQNVPVLSYLFLRGKCASCGAKISPRYPIVELGTALLSVAVAWKFGLHWYTAAALAYTWILIALSGIDLDHQLLPDSMTLSLLWLGLLVTLVGSADFGWLPPDTRSSILGAVLGYLSLWTINQLYMLVRKEEGMAAGDFKLLAALGAWLGWKSLLLVVLLSSFTGALVGIVLMVFKGRDHRVRIPFGPFLAAAGWIALMWGEDITSGFLPWYSLR